jgi:hypothetical protein
VLLPEQFAIILFGTLREVCRIKTETAYAPRKTLGKSGFILPILPIRLRQNDEAKSLVFTIPSPNQ